MMLLMMANNNNNNNNSSSSNSIKEPIFHEFFVRSPVDEVVPKQSLAFRGYYRLSEASASSAGGHGPVSATSDLGERNVSNHIEGVPLHGHRTDFYGTKISNGFQGRKESTLESLDSPSRKKLRSIMGGEQQRSHEEELFSSLKSSRPMNSTTLMLQPPVGRQPDSIASKWEQSPMNTRPAVQNPPCLGQFATYVDMVSSNRYMDGNACSSVISQHASDEGSRTGIKVPERNTSGVLLSGCRPKSGPQTADPGSSNPPSQHGLMSPTQQMTIFYAGQAHVFDDVHPKKADAIMALAGSNGGSRSTFYSPKSSMPQSLGGISLQNGENEMGISNLAIP